MSQQEQITQWAKDTFGPQDPAVIAARMNNEVAELITGLLSAPDNVEHNLAECADVYIMLVQIVENLGGDLQKEVATKMAINQQRKWTKTASGKVQHV